VFGARAKQIGDLGHQGKGAAAAVPVASRIGPLGDKDVGADLDRGDRIGTVVDLTDQRHLCGGQDARGEWAGIAKRQKDRSWLALEHRVQDVGRATQCLGDQAAPHRRVARLVETGIDPRPTPAGPWSPSMACATRAGAFCSLGAYR